MNMVPDQPYLSSLSELPDKVVFIMGCHRSGTTFLHNLLAATGRFSFLSAYEVIRFPEILSNRRNGVEAQAKRDLMDQIKETGIDRGLDHIPVNVEAPEEYGFILPGYDLFVPRLTPENRVLFGNILKKKAALDGTTKPLLLKEPNEFYGNFGYVVSEFPDAFYLFNHRHPLTVLQSHVTSWTLVYERENPYLFLLNERYREIMSDPMERMHHRLFMHTRDAVNLILDHLVAGCRYYMDHIGSVSEARRMIFRYEDLCQDSKNRFDNILMFLEVEPVAELAFDVRPRTSSISPMVQECYEERLDEFRPYLTLLSYDPYPG